MIKRKIVGIIVIVLILIGIIISFKVIKKENNELNQDDYKQEENININNLDDFYNNSLTKDKDIRKLKKDYTTDEASQDNCYIVGYDYNDKLYKKFMSDYENKKSSFLRIIKHTIEGNLIIYDLLYYEKTDKLYLVSDNTRDKYSSSEDRTIELKEYNYIGNFTYNKKMCWGLYNDEIDEDSFEIDGLFIISST